MGPLGRIARGSEVAQFALSGLVATLLIGLVAVAAMRSTGRGEAVRDAKQVARLAGEGIVEPYVTPGLLAGDPRAVRRLDRVVHRRVLRDGIVRVKVWTREGRIVYSDEPRLIGQRYRLSPADLREFSGDEVEAELSDLGKPENRYERRFHELQEVYLPIRAPGGQRVLFETYLQQSSVSASGRRLWLAFAPALLGGLLLLQLVNLPLARSMVRRLRQGQEEREGLLQHALDASDMERRRIAADLHDGVVQDLAGVSYALAAQAQRLAGEGDEEGAGVLRGGARQTRESVRALRTLLVDIYPPSLHSAGLAAALADVATTTSARGLETRLEIPEGGLELSDRAEELLFRCAQEALRNCQRHAQASSATIVVTQDNGRAALEVRDDGRGFDVLAARSKPGEGHFGLAVLGDLVIDAGGRLDVRSQPGAGTTVRVEVPSR